MAQYTLCLHIKIYKIIDAIFCFQVPSVTWRMKFIPINLSIVIIKNTYECSLDLLCWLHLTFGISLYGFFIFIFLPSAFASSPQLFHFCNSAFYLCISQQWSNHSSTTMVMILYSNRWIWFVSASTSVPRLLVYHR